MISSGQLDGTSHSSQDEHHTVRGNKIPSKEIWANKNQNTRLFLVVWKCILMCPLMMKVQRPLINWYEPGWAPQPLSQPLRDRQPRHCSFSLRCCHHISLPGISWLRWSITRNRHPGSLAVITPSSMGWSPGPSQLTTDMDLTAVVWCRDKFTISLSSDFVQRCPVMFGQSQEVSVCQLVISSLAVVCLSSPDSDKNWHLYISELVNRLWVSLWCRSAARTHYFSDNISLHPF